MATIPKREHTLMTDSKRSQLNTSKHKGRVGEARVDARLRPSIFKDTGSRQINNLVLLDSYGNSHQIDRLEIRSNGIFCIEIKNYSGCIFGGADQEAWTQFFENGQQRQFMNPLLQNQSHVHQIGRVLGGKYLVHSIVVMVQNNADQVNLPNVVNLNDLRAYLKSVGGGTRYSAAEIDDLYRRLLRAGVQMSNNAHVQNIEQKRLERQETTCPECGGKLVLRNGIYGEFWGCSNYPKCHFTRKKKTDGN